MGDGHKRAGVYGRESQGKGSSIDDQVQVGERVVGEQGWLLAGTYRDGSSASRFAKRRRADWDQLCADLSAGLLDVLVLWESSRGSREPISWFGMLAVCQRRGILVHVVSHERTYDLRRARDWKLLADDGVMAADEANKISERSRRGTRSAAAAGLPHGHVPYGYARVYDEATGKFLEQREDPTYGPIARELIQRVGKGDPVNSLLVDLVQRGIASPRGRTWTRKAIRDLCLNVAYRGQRSHHGELHDAVWPPLVSDEEWLAARAVLTAPGRQKSKPGSARWLLSYIAKTTCGYPLNVNPKTGRQRAFYRCTLDMCCTLPVEDLDEVVTRLVVARFARADARTLFATTDDPTQAARFEVAELERELDAARDSVGPGGISVASLARIERNLQARIEDARARSLRLSVPAAVVDLLDAAEVGASAIRPAWDAMPIARKRAIVAGLLDITLLPLGDLPRLSRWSTTEERLARAAERSVIRWRSEADGDVE